MYHLKLLLLVVLISFCSTNADLATQEGDLGAQLTYSMPQNRLRLLPSVLPASGLVADSNALQYFNSKHQSPPSNSPLRTYGNPKCQSEGRIADPNDCGQYYDCVRDNNRNIIANKQSCLGHAFDATLKSCVPAREAKGCILDYHEFRSVSVDEPSIQNICKSYDNEFICLDCRTLIMCVDRQPHIIPCKSGNVCYNTKEAFKGGVCYPDAPVECTCNNDDIFRQDYYDSSKFISCESKGADPVVQSCPVGLEFNERRRTCGTPIDTSCSDAGTFTLKSDCTRFHSCIYTTAGWFQRNFTCNDKTMFNEQTGKCEDPCGWYSGNFACKEEGRFSNLRDCTTFFECITDPQDTDKFLQTEHVCPEGYEWLPMVNRHHCVAKGSTIGKCEPQNPNICEIPSEWCSSTRDAVMDKSSKMPLRNYESSKCFTEGRIADPQNCGQYYDCVRGSNGDFIANKQSCFGHAFDATLKECVTIKEAKGCILDSTDVYRSVSVDEPSLQNICKSYDNEFICLDCKTLVMCVDRQPHIIPCKSGNVCYNDKEAFKGGVCYPDAPVECTCNNDDIFRQDYYDSSKFLSCESKGADPVVQSCPVGLEFNKQLRSCGTPIDTSCSEAGTFALKSDCTNYHTCIDTTDGWFQRNFTCTDNTMYNKQTGKCEDPCDWYDGNFICKEEGRFPNPLDCTTFFECIENPLEANEFIQIEHVCPDGYEWLPMVTKYHCVAKGSTKEKCIPQKLNICEIPSEWCPSKSDVLPTTTTTTTQPPPTPEELCNADGGIMMGEQCLTFSNGPVSCDNAMATCTSQGGTLASIVDYDGMAAHLISKYGIGGSVWIGPTDTYKETIGDGDNVMHLYMLGLEKNPHFSYHFCADMKEYICEIDISAPASSPGISTPAPLVLRNVCPDGHFQVGSQCFFIPTAGFKNWYGAQELCKVRGGLLAEPDSIADFHEALSKETSGYGFWLGGSNINRGGNWRWSSRGAMVGNSASWYPGGPETFDTTEKCLFLMRGVEKPLAARFCDSEHHYFICEKH